MSEPYAAAAEFANTNDSKKTYEAIRDYIFGDESLGFTTNRLFYNQRLIVTVIGNEQPDLITRTWFEQALRSGKPFQMPEELKRTLLARRANFQRLNDAGIIPERAEHRFSSSTRVGAVIDADGNEVEVSDDVLELLAQVFQWRERASEIMEEEHADRN